MIKSYDSSDLFECIQTREITSDASELLNDILSVSLEYDEELYSASYIAINQSKTKEFTLYRISSDNDESNSFSCVNFAVDELDNFIIKDVRPTNKSFEYTINQLLIDSGCDWSLGVCNPVSTVTSTFYYISMREALKSLQGLGCEFTFTVEVTGNEISNKIINCYNQIGVVTNKRFEYDDEVLSIVREVLPAHAGVILY